MEDQPTPPNPIIEEDPKKKILEVLQVDQSANKSPVKKPENPESEKVLDIPTAIDQNDLDVKGTPSCPTTDQNLPNISESMRLTQKDHTEEYEKLYEVQLENIKKEVREQQIIGFIEPFTGLYEEFQGSANFLKKIHYMNEKLNKSCIRRIRKDGSCFYRGFLFGLAEHYLFGRIDFEEGPLSFDKVWISFISLHWPY